MMPKGYFIVPFPNCQTIYLRAPLGRTPPAIHALTFFNPSQHRYLFCDHGNLPLFKSPQKFIVEGRAHLAGNMQSSYRKPRASTPEHSECKILNQCGGILPTRSTNKDSVPFFYKRKSRYRMIDYTKEFWICHEQYSIRKKDVRP